MSGVLKRKRNPTSADYIDSAWEMRKKTLQICMRFPKRYSDWITKYIVQFSAECHIYCFEANQIYPKTKEQAKQREELLKKAVRALNQMYPQIELAYGMFKLDSREGGESNEKILERWLPELMETERLIKAIMKSDRQRFKNLPE